MEVGKTKKLSPTSRSMLDCALKGNSIEFSCNVALS